MGRFTRIAGAALAATALASPGGAPAAGEEPPLRAEHRGITLIALPPDPAIVYDVDVVSSEGGIEALRRAVDLILARSPFSAARIATLKRAGAVYIVYDPLHPEKKPLRTELKVAKFQPGYLEMYGIHGGPRTFVAVVSRHGIKWPVPELAAVLVHELAGHGTQHLRGRMHRTSHVDLEREAWLHEEQAYQDLGFDKTSRRMIKFRQELEGVGFTDGYCSDFKRYIRDRAPARMKLWNSLNPDVPGLLELFETYVGERRR
jgi:hypothetical protein